MSRLFTREIAVINISNTCISIAGISWAWHANDPHIAQRVGALVAAFTGIFVVFQIIDEIRMENEQHNVAKFNPEEETPVLGALARRLIKNRGERKKLALRSARLGLVVAIAGWLSFGELLHGFGDIAFECVRSAFEG